MTTHIHRFTFINFTLLTIALAAITSASNATNPVHIDQTHVVEKGVSYNHPAPLPEMESRIVEAAARYRQYAPVPRLALFDIAFPSDRKEWASTGYNAVLIVSALSQEADELPITRVFVRSGGSDIELRLIASSNSAEPQKSDVAIVFGVHRWDGMYLLPCNLVAHRGELMVDFASHRKAFSIGTIGNPGDHPDWLDERNSTFGDSDLRAVNVLAAREYPGLAMALPSDQK